MKRQTTACLILLPIVAIALYFFFKPHRQDPHYYAAVCVVIDAMGEPASATDFADKLHDVIINENSSYAVDKVAFDRQSAQGAIQRYMKLNDMEKTQAHQGMDACLAVMMPKQPE
ncbi:hypothetical protein ACMGGR_02840 [Erwinia sp. BNK-24-b]|uniref:hypothetical protein n=1 Tax=unclassified Erwinia TaxID=2622719 RepID=UPI0039BF4F1A